MCTGIVRNQALMAHSFVCDIRRYTGCFSAYEDGLSDMIQWGQ
ncbi:hypothetical protein [Paenibacillus popilliae]|nr:hypothetical protein [Paenibacillus popilliae]